MPSLYRQPSSGITISGNPGDWIGLPPGPPPIYLEHVTNVSIAQFPNQTKINFEGQIPALFKVFASNKVDFDVVAYGLSEGKNKTVDITFTGEIMPGHGRRLLEAGKEVTPKQQREAGKELTPKQLVEINKFMERYLTIRPVLGIINRYIPRFRLGQPVDEIFPIPIPPPPSTRPPMTPAPGAPPLDPNSLPVLAVSVNCTVDGITYPGIAVYTLPEGWSQPSFFDDSSLRWFIKKAGWDTRGIEYSFSNHNIEFYTNIGAALWQSGRFVPNIYNATHGQGYYVNPVYGSEITVEVPKRSPKKSPKKSHKRGGKRHRRRTAKTNGNKRKRATRTRGAMKLKTVRKARRTRHR
jgi:hypothetical protein